jgi:3-isopropylmalate dehydrogenase
MAKEYPEVDFQIMLVDNCAMQIVKDPSQFDVIVTENMFGDILSDEASQITGSIGMIPSSSLGQTSRGLYEPIHGSAPDLAGTNTVNPLACILSAAMMLRYSFDLVKEADAIEKAVGDALDAGVVTADLAAQGQTPVSTVEMTDAVLKYLAAA